MKKKLVSFIILLIPFVSIGQIIFSSTESSRFLTTYTNGAANDSVFVFCQPSAAPALSAKMTGGTAPYTFTWYRYNTTTHSYPVTPYATIVNASISTISSLSSGGYKVIITDATSAVMGCDVAWVWNINMTPDAGANLSACIPFSLAGTVNMNNTGTFKYYNPQASSLTIGPSTTISVCLDVLHTYVSDLSFHLIGPASCGSPNIILSANPGSIGQGNFCNSGDNCSNLCFSSASVANLNVCTAIAPLTGTYGRYGAGAGTAINWAALNGCNAAAGGWSIQIYDCFASDIGTLTDATISFSNPGTCGTDNISYYTGIVNSAITDNACSAGTASLFSIPADTIGITATNVNTFLWTASPAVTINNATTLTPSIPSTLFNPTTFFLTVNSNRGCSKVDSLHFTPCAVAAPIIHSTTATSKFLTAYTSGAANDSVFVFCQPSAVSSLSATGTGGTAPYTFNWYYYNTNAHQYSLSPVFTTTAAATSTATNLATGGYKLVVTDVTSSVVGCDYAWVWNINLSVDAGANFSGCGPFSLAGSINNNNTNTFKYYNPPADQLIIGPSTSITVCFTGIHTWVSDLAFHLIGPASCGSPDILLSPNPGANGQANICNSNNDINGLCFTTTTGANFDPCNELGGVNAGTTASNYSGTYSSYGPAAGAHTPINWSALYGCNASNGGFTLQIWDCVTGDVGALTNTTISFTGPGTCGMANVNYTSGNISSAINDGACSSVLASTYTTTYPVLDTTPIIVTNVVSFAWTAVPAFTIPNSTTSLTPNLNPNPLVDTRFYLTVNGNHGCPKVDSVIYDFVAPAVPAITPISPLCNNASAVTLSASPAGGVFSGTGVTGNSINPAGLSGNITVTYVVGSGGCLASNTSTVAVTALPVATFSYTGTPYCQNASNPSPVFSGGGVAGTFTSAPGLSIIPSTGLVNLALSTPGTYTVTNTIAASGACAAVIATAAITITSVPVATFSYPGSTYCLGSGINPAPVFSGGGVAGIFTASPAGLIINGSTGIITTGTSAVGTYTVTNTIAGAGGCSGTSATASVTISTAQAATFGYPNDPYCQVGTNPFPTFSVGSTAGTFTSSPAGLNFVSANTGVVDLTNTLLGSYTITNTIAATAGCLSANASATLNITQLPEATFNYPSNPFCPSAGVVSANFIGAGQPGVFSSSSANLLVDANTGDVDISGSLPGSYFVYNLLPASDGCPDVLDSAQVTITSSPVATFNYPSNTYCSGGANPSPVFTGGGLPGVFSSTLGLNFVSTSTGVVDLTTSLGGTYTVTNTIPAAGGCPAGVATSTITITSGPVASFSYPSSSYCQSGVDPSPVFTGGGVGGTFTSSPAGLVINSSNGIVTLASSSAGSYTVTNTIAASGGCPQVVATSSINIITTPVATFSYTLNPYCQSGSNPSPTFSGGGFAGTFTASPVGLSINSVTGIVDLAFSSSGTYTVTNTVSAGGCPNAVANTTLTITALPLATFSYTGGSFCQSGTDPLPTFIPGGTGGTFTASSSGLIINSSTGLVTLASSAPGTYTVTNTIAPVGGCPQVIAISTITIVATPLATFSYTGSPYCQSASNPLPTFGGGALSGTFTSSPAGLSIDSNTGLITLGSSSAGTYTVTNTVLAGGCPNVIATSVVTITALPEATFSYTSNPYCQNGTDPLPTFSGAGVAGNFTSSPGGLTINSVTGLVTLFASSGGSYTVTNTIPASGGCPSVVVSSSINITTVPVATFGYTSSPYCQDAVNPSPSFSGGGIAGTFSSSPIGLSINSSTGNVDLVASIPGTYTVTNTIIAAGCSNVVATSTITITALPVATFSYLGSPYCQSATNPFPTFSGGGIAGTFTVSPGGLVIDAISGLITLSTSSAGTYTITNTIAASAGCAGVSATSTLTIIQTPVASFNYSGNPYCINASNPAPSYTGGGIAGTFTSSPAGLTINSSTGIIDLTTSLAGTYTVTNTVPAAGCPDVIATSVITITALPVATFNYAASTYCQLGTDPLPTFIGGGIAGTFTSSAGLVINSSTGQVSLSTSVCGTYTVTNTIAATGGCPQITASSSITIVCAPIASFSYTATPYCQFSANPFPSFSGGGAAGIFSSTAGLVIDSLTGQVDLLASIPGTYTVTNTFAAGICAAVSATSSITITAVPIATFTYTGTPYCACGANPSPVFSGGGVAGAFTSTPGLSINGITGVVDLCASTPGTYVVTNTIAASGGCPLVAASASITIIPVNVGTFSYPSITYCAGGSNPSPTFSGGGIAGIFTSTTGLVIDSLTGIVDLATSTIGSYIVTNNPPSAGGCSSVSDTAIINIVAAPIATFSYNAITYCQNATNPSPIFIGGGTGGVFSSTTGLVIDSITGLIDLLNSTIGTYTISNTIASIGGCSAAITLDTITIIASPVATFSYAGSPYCVGSANPSPTFGGGGTGGTFTSTSGLVIDTLTGVVDIGASTPGTYTVSNTIPAGACPSVTDTSVLIISPLPIANAGADQNFICGNSAVILNGTLSSSGTNIVYLWTTVNGHIVSGNTTTSPSVDLAGTYILTVTDTSSHCSAGDTVLVAGTPGPSASFTANPLTGSPPLTVNFTNSSSGGSIFTWTFGTGDSSMVINPDYIYTASGTYTVTLMVSDSAGCSDTASATVFVFDEYSMVAGNVFTPNGDGINDLFYISSAGIEFAEGDIYDRWGIKMFTFHAVKEGWDGRTITGQEAQPGTYYYIVKTIGFDGTEHEENGFFVLIR